MSAESTYQDQWYESYHSIIFTPPGEIPQVRGHWTDYALVEEMLNHLKSEYPEGTPMLVVSSRCGNIDVTNADEWLMMHKIGMECAAEEAEYVRKGICADCGACSRKEAESKCRPKEIADTGDYSCAGERLWEDEPEDDEDPTIDGSLDWPKR